MEETKYKKWKICPICGKRFFAKRDYKKLSQKFCSLKCFGKNKKGKKNNCPAWNKGRKMGDYPQCGFQKGHKPFLLSKKQYKEIGDTMRLKLKGRIVPIEQRKKMSKAKKKIPSKILLKNLGKYAQKGKRADLSGKNNWNWKGGITPERTKIWHSLEYKKWRESVYQRDNYTCQKCGDNSGHLIPHHIESFADYPNLRFDINNGITLCKRCHTYFHSKYSTHHNNRKQLNEFLNEKQESIITQRGRQIMVNSVSKR